MADRWPIPRVSPKQLAWVTMKNILTLRLPSIVLIVLVALVFPNPVRAQDRTLSDQAAKLFGVQNPRDLARSILYHTDYVFFTRKNFEQKEIKVGRGNVDLASVVPDLTLVDNLGSSRTFRKWSSKLVVKEYLLGLENSQEISHAIEEFLGHISKFVPVAYVERDSPTNVLIFVSHESMGAAHSILDGLHKQRRSGTLLDLSPPSSRSRPWASWGVSCLVEVDDRHRISKVAIYLMVPKREYEAPIAVLAKQYLNRCFLPMMGAIQDNSLRDDSKDLAMAFMYLDEIEPGMTYIDALDVYERSIGSGK